MESRISEAKKLKSEIEIKTSRIKGFIASLISLIMVILGFRIIFTGANSLVGFILIIISFVGILFFGAGLIAGIIITVKPKVFLKINSEGLTLNPFLQSPIQISWNEIEGFSSYSFYTIKINVSNIQRIKRASNRLTKFSLWFSKSTGRAPLTIGSQSLDISHEALLEVLKLALIKHKPQS